VAKRIAALTGNQGDLLRGLLKRLHPLIWPTGKSLSSPDPRNISLHRLVETALWIPTVSSHRGAWTRERSNGARANDVAAYGDVVWS
jgi:hypothetical protein